MPYYIRPATVQDTLKMEALIRESARVLSSSDYSADEIATAITHVFGVDSELLADGSYFVVEDEGDALLACGGWSRRKTLFGGDRFTARESGYLDPAQDAAKIRAFFVHPVAARRGIGRALLMHCEEAARQHGFTRAEMMATLPGVKLYAACGYAAKPQELYHAPDGKTVRFVPMVKAL